MLDCSQLSDSCFKIAFLSTLGMSQLCSDIDYPNILISATISSMHSLKRLVVIGSSLQYLLGKLVTIAFISSLYIYSLKYHCNPQLMLEIFYYQIKNELTLTIQI